MERRVGGAGSAGYKEPEESVTNIFLGFHHRKWKTNSRVIPGKKMTKLGWEWRFCKRVIERELRNSLLGRQSVAGTVEVGPEKGAHGM